MAIFKATMQFQSASSVSDPTNPARRVGGFSESWYDDSTSAGDVLASMNNGGGLCERRAALLPIGSRIVGQRAQQVDPTVGRSISLGRNFPGGAGAAADIPQMALLFSVPSVGGLHIRRAVIRTVPDIIVKEGEYDPVPPFPANLALFFAELAFFKIRGLFNNGNIYDVNTVSLAGLVTTVQDHGFEPGDSVYIKGSLRVGGGGTFAKQAKVLVRVSDLSFTINEVPLWATSGGTVQELAYTYPDINAAGITPSRIVTRKVGAPFDKYRGRASRRKK